MLRRKPTKIKLDLEDLAEYIEQKKQSKEQSANKSGNTGNTTFEISETLPVIDRAINPEARRAQVQRRIGFSPAPVTPEATTQFSNIY
uniref:anaphase-promoting complex subunit CDC26-like n=1 Tax=Styela clava TaxID=7725 RepID=UPI00193A0A03|nr:anaphase-promoting complex subunit CDC26-like [Styela clava]